MNSDNPIERLVVSRRTFLAGVAASASLAFPDHGQAIQNSLPAALYPRRPQLVDVNVSIGRWPNRSLNHSDPSKLNQLLKRHQVSQAWVGTFDALLHKDLSSANSILAHECKRFGRRRWVPFGSVNPAAPDWVDDLDRCFRSYEMPGVRLHPGYHGYDFNHPGFIELLDRSQDLGRIVQISFLMEDERMMHPLLRPPHPNPTRLPEILSKFPHVNIVLLNAFRVLHGPLLLQTIAAASVSIDIATLEGVAGIETLLAQVPPNRVLFGSHAPLFYFESAALKLAESQLTAEHERNIRSENSRRLLEKVPLHASHPH